MAITKAQADELLARGQIGPDTHAMIVAGASTQSSFDPGMSSAPPAASVPLAPAPGGFNPQLDMAPPPPRPGSGITTAPMNAAERLGMGPDPFGLGASAPVPSTPSPMASAAPAAPLPMPGPGRTATIPMAGGPGTDDPFGLKAMTSAPAPQGPGTANPFGMQPGSAPPPQAPTPIGPPPPPAGTAAPTRPTEKPAAPVNRPTPTAGSVAPRPAAPSGPSDDPRVNAAYARYMKQYAGVLAAGDKVMEAQGRALEQERIRDQRLADNSREFVDAIERMDVQAQVDLNDYQQAAQAQQERIRLAADQAAAAKVDPEKFWKDKGTGGQILGAVAIALGSLGAAMAKTPNFALQIIDNAIARDIAAQEKNLDQNWKKVDSERGILGDLRQIYGDKRMARADAYKRAYDRTIAVGEQIAAESKNPIAAAKWEETKALLNEKRAAHEFDVLQGLQARQAQMDAAAASAMRAREAEERKFYYERFGKAIDSAQEELQKAAAEQRSPQPWAVETIQRATDKGLFQISGGVTGAAGNAGDPLAGIPKKYQDKALEELPKLQQKQEALSFLSQMEKDAKDRSPLNPLNLVPGTDARERDKRIDLYNARVVSFLRGVGDADARSEERLAQFQIGYRDTNEEIATKVRLMQQKVRGNLPTPLLDTYGKSGPSGVPGAMTTDTSGFTGVKK